ncbi:hypothetical protein TSUD_409320 [Trifolium subterraneum]|uniref:Integrase catalytic domain-containing protein n=1 Tax=Trifolium subterraneum TaxID=3900 RepID=A0A2Z6PSD8_TRISU|nr:hypothetical protein TSUD_409320 [Trifolium subterraneum]
MRGQNELIREQNRRIRAVEDSRAASRISRSVRQQRSPTPVNNRSRSRSRSPRPAPRRSVERPLSPPRDNHRRKNYSPPQRSNHHSPPRNKRSPPRWNNRSPPKNGEAAARGGNARHSPRRESPGNSDEHVQSVETALDYRNLRGSIKCKLFPLSLVRGGSTWWRNLPPGSIDSWEELCRMFTAHFTISRRHPKTVVSLKAIIQGPEESLRSYIEMFNKVSVEVEATDKMKLYLLEEGLCEGAKFQEAVGIVEVQTLDAFFELAQRYIKWEDKQKASKVRRPRNFEVGGPSSQREERRGDEKRREGGNVREAKPPKSQFTYHTPLNATQDRILSEISSADFKSAGDAIEILIQKGYARQYIDGQQRTANNAPRQNQLAVDPASPEQHVEEENRVIGGVALAISRPEDFLPLPNNEEKEALDYLAAHLDGSWESFLGALVISGGGFNPVTIGSIKRKFDELEKASPVGEIKITEVKESSVPLAFYREEVPGGSLNFQIPLLDSLKCCSLPRKIWSLMFDLTFKGSTTKPWGYVDLIVTFGENKAMKSVKVKFLVVDCPSLYNYIIGRPTLAELFAVSSTIHLKLKYYTKDGQKKKEETKLPGVNSISIEDTVELDARTSKKERKQEKKAIKDDLLIKENFRPIPDGEFELVPLGEDPTKGVKIGVDLPDLVKRQLKACLRENAELFAWSAAEIPGIDPEQSPEKAEAARKAVKDLLEANFIAEAQYTTWLSNVVLVKKSNGKWLCATYQRMMNKVFHNEIGDMLEVYMDDMIVKSEEEIDHTLHLKRVFDQARKFNMRFNPEKCTFWVKAGKFLGFYLTERGIEANPDKCRAFFDYPTPKSKKSIQTLNGMLTSMAKFVAKSAQHALPLFKLLRKETTFEWTEECEGALQHLKRALSESPVLTRPVEDKKLYLYLAVTSEAISAVLIRETEQGQKPVYFVSRALQGPELRYLQIEKIALAVIMAARKLRYYFLAHSIVIRTDQPVKQLLARPDMVGRMLKWSLELAEFDISFESPNSQLVVSQVSGEYQTKEERLLEYLNLIKTKLAKFKETEVKHVPREHNAREDVLSKLASTRRKKAGNQSLIQETLTKPSIEKAVEVMHICAIDDQSWMAPVYNFLKSNTLPADAKEATKIRKRAFSYVLLDDKLYRRGFSIPLLKSLRAGYYWPTMQNDAKDHVLKCDKCQRHGDMHIAPANELKTLISPWPFSWWGMDILGPFPTAARQVKYLIVVVDYFTKWIEAEPLAKIGASHIVRFFKRNVLARFGIPQVVVTDNGTQFTNKKFQEFLATIGTTQHFTSVEDLYSKEIPRTWNAEKLKQYYS